MPDQLQVLQNLVHDCLAKHLYDSAIFFADKLVTLSNYAPAEVYTLAQAFFVNRQYRRCLHLLRATDLTSKDIRFRYLAARCLAESKEWDECLETLGGMDAETFAQLSITPLPHQATSGSSSNSGTGAMSYASAISLLRGKVYDAMENFPLATNWYKQALTLDPFNYEAFELLISSHKLSNDEELKLVEGLEIPPEHGWLALLYRSKCKKYSGNEEADRALELLENEPPNKPPAPTTSAPPPSGASPSRNPPSSTTKAPRSSSHQQPQSATRTRPGTRASSRLSPSHSEPMSISPATGGGDNESTGTAAPMQSEHLHNQQQQQQPFSNATGWGLGDNIDVAACRSEWLVQRGMFKEAYALSKAALEADPFAKTLLIVHLAACIELRKKNELFLLAHKLVEAEPANALSWYAVGCYYYCTGQFESARRYFGKATVTDKNLAAAWVAFGHAFAAQDEGDQSMAAYRAAARLFPGLHAPLVGMGTEYGKMSNLHLAEQMLMKAHRLCPSDPLVCNELGVLAYRNKRYEDAVAWLSRALEMTPSNIVSHWEPTLVNLGHALRKLRRFEESINCYERALGMNPNCPSTYAALGYTCHLAGDTGSAVEHYHKSLGLRPEDGFVGTMLSLALVEEADRFGEQLRITAGPTGY